MFKPFRGNGNAGSTQTGRSGASALAPLRCPVGKLLLVHLDIKLGNPLLQPGLRIGHALVVDRRPDFLEKKGKQSPRLQPANRLIHVFLEIALNGSDCRLAGVGGDFDGHVGCGRKLERKADCRRFGGKETD